MQPMCGLIDTVIAVLSICLSIHASICHTSVSFKSLTPNVHCCHMGIAIKHHVPDRVKPKPSFVIFDSDSQPWAPECPDVKN